MSASSRILRSRSGKTSVKRADLMATLDAAPDANKDRFIFLRADRAVAYGDLMDVMELLRIGGYTKMKLVALEGVAMRRHLARPVNLQSPEGRLRCLISTRS